MTNNNSERFSPCHTPISQWKGVPLTLLNLKYDFAELYIDCMTLNILPLISTLNNNTASLSFSSLHDLLVLHVDLNLEPDSLGTKLNMGE